VNEQLAMQWPLHLRKELSHGTRWLFALKEDTSPLMEIDLPIPVSGFKKTLWQMGFFHGLSLQLDATA
jgi:hypothetical protein